LNDELKMKKLFIYTALVLSLCISFQGNSVVVQVNKNADENILTDTKQLLEILSVYNYGDSRAWLNDFQNLMRRVHSNPDIYPEIEDLMLNFLKSDALYPGKLYICTQIGVIGSRKSVPVLYKMLLDETSSEIALLGLEPIVGPEADKALLKGLSKTSGKYKVGIINSLGVRKCPDAIKPLSKLISGKDLQIASASIAALGKIGTANATDILEDAFRKTTAPLKWEISDALLKTTDPVNNKDQSFKIYKEIYDSNPPVSIKTAALKGLISTYSGNPDDYLLPALNDPDPAMQEAVIPIIRNLDGLLDTDKYLHNSSSLDENTRAQLILALADRGDPIAHDQLLELIKSDSKDLRLAGLRTFPEYAKTSDIVFLANLAASTKGRERDLVRECLNTMKGENVEDAILRLVLRACPDPKVELIRAMGQRNITEGCEILLITAKHKERKVRLESYKILGKIASSEYLTEVIALMINSQSNADRREAEKAVVSIAKTIPEKTAQSQEILKLIPDLIEVDAIVSCINVLGALGVNNSLDILKDYLNHDESKIRIASIKALSEWPDAAPKMKLKNVLMGTEDKKEHTLAMQGYIRLTIMDTSIDEKEKTVAVIEALEIAQNPNEKKIVMSGLAKVNCIDALNFAIELLDNPELQKEAEAAVLDISGDVGRNYPQKTRDILNQLLTQTESPEFKSKIEETLKWMK